LNRKLFVAFLLAAGCGPSMPDQTQIVELDPGPLAWNWDPAAPSHVLVTMEARLTEEAGAYARIDTLEGNALLTVAEPFPPGTTLVLDDGEMPVNFTLVGGQRDVRIDAFCPGQGCTSESRLRLEAPEGTVDPIEVTVELMAELHGWFRDPEDAEASLEAEIVAE
jgi:hypothetical protein